MKIKDFIGLEIDIDVYDNVCEELGIAFCGSLSLTEEGERHFAEVLDYDITVDEANGVAIVDIDTPDDGWKRKLRKAIEFFNAAAGYCADEDYTKWFADDGSGNLKVCEHCLCGIESHEGKQATREIYPEEENARESRCCWCGECGFTVLYEIISD